MSDYAILDTNNIVMMIVKWDGDTETWQPPEGAASWVDVTDPDVFVEVGGRLDPVTLELERDASDVYTPEMTASMPVSASDTFNAFDALLGVLKKNGTITPEEADELAPLRFIGPVDVDPVV